MDESGTICAVGTANSVPSAVRRITILGSSSDVAVVNSTAFPGAIGLLRIGAGSGAAGTEGVVLFYGKAALLGWHFALICQEWKSKGSRPIKTLEREFLAWKDFRTYPGSLGSPSGTVPGAYIVQFHVPPVAHVRLQRHAPEIDSKLHQIKDDLHAARIQRVHAEFEKHVANSGVKFTKRHVYSEHLFSGVSIQLEDINHRHVLQSHPHVKAIHPVQIMRAPPIVRKFVRDNTTWASPDGLNYTGDLRAFALGTIDDPTKMLTGVTSARKDKFLTGNGVLIGIVDSGLDITHPAFGGCNGDPGSDQCNRIKVAHDFVGDVYDGNVPPTVRGPMKDCSGIIGGRMPKAGTNVDYDQANSAYEGIAPNVAFAIFRVFGCEGQTTNDVLLAAIDMAFQSGCDAINLSLGYEGSAPGDVVMQALELITRAVVPRKFSRTNGRSRTLRKGTGVFVAHGNSQESGVWNTNTQSAGLNVVAVAAANSIAYRTVMKFTLIDVYGNSVSRPVDFQYGRVAPPGNARNYPIVVNAAPGIVNSNSLGDACSPADVNPGIRDSIALVKRGGCLFMTKVNNLKAVGAVAVIFYNNFPTMGGSLSSIPILDSHVFNFLVFTINSMEDGMYLAQKILNYTERDEMLFPGIGKTVELKMDEVSGSLSTFTSWGYSASAAQKPDFTAIGGSVFSTYPMNMGAFAVLSGTSMASPWATGSFALVYEQVLRTVDNHENGKWRFDLAPLRIIDVHSLVIPALRATASPIEWELFRTYGSAINRFGGVRALASYLQKSIAEVITGNFSARGVTPLLGSVVGHGDGRSAGTMAPIALQGAGLVNVARAASLAESVVSEALFENTALSDVIAGPGKLNAGYVRVNESAPFKIFRFSVDLTLLKDLGDIVVSHHPALTHDVSDPLVPITLFNRWRENATLAPGVTFWDDGRNAWVPTLRIKPSLKTRHVLTIAAKLDYGPFLTIAGSAIQQYDYVVAKEPIPTQGQDVPVIWPNYPSLVPAKASLRLDQQSRSNSPQLYCGGYIYIEGTEDPLLPPPGFPRAIPSPIKSPWAPLTPPIALPYLSESAKEGNIDMPRSPAPYVLVPYSMFLSATPQLRVIDEQPGFGYNPVTGNITRAISPMPLRVVRRALGFTDIPAFRENKIKVAMHDWKPHESDERSAVPVYQNHTLPSPSLVLGNVFAPSNITYGGWSSDGSAGFGVLPDRSEEYALLISNPSTITAANSAQDLTDNLYFNVRLVSPVKSLSIHILSCIPYTQFPTRFSNGTAINDDADVDAVRWAAGQDPTNFCGGFTISYLSFQKTELEGPTDTIRRVRTLSEFMNATEMIHVAETRVPINNGLGRNGAPMAGEDLSNWSYLIPLFQSTSDPDILFKLAGYTGADGENITEYLKHKNFPALPPIASNAILQRSVPGVFDRRANSPTYNQYVSLEMLKDPRKNVSAIEVDRETWTLTAPVPDYRKGNGWFYRTVVGIRQQRMYIPPSATEDGTRESEGPLVDYNMTDPASIDFDGIDGPTDNYVQYEDEIAWISPVIWWDAPPENPAPSTE
ncbi:hypothetical protein BJ742DRAFT_877959 [Cladochytrium replicatum]|nr:hypothetical protein BJ742DRAFT_877959 [Cladochytrium replicatum]